MRIAAFAISLATLFAALGSAGSAQASGLSGAWSPAPGDRPSEVFSLHLLVRGNAVCGAVMATSHEATHIDDSHVVGVVRGNTAQLVFGTREGDASARGRATVRLDGGTLHWSISRPLLGSDLWPRANLRRGAPADAEESAALRAWCAPRWQRIQDDGMHGIALRDGAAPDVTPPDPQQTRRAIAALLAASTDRLPRGSSCTVPGASGRPATVGDVLASRLAYLDRGANVIEGHCKAGHCEVLIRHANGEDVAFASLRFRQEGGRARVSTLTCAFTP